MKFTAVILLSAFACLVASMPTPHPPESSSETGEESSEKVQDNPGIPPTSSWTSRRRFYKSENQDGSKQVEVKMKRCDQLSEEVDDDCVGVVEIDLRVMRKPRRSNNSSSDQNNSWAFIHKKIRKILKSGSVYFQRTVARNPTKDRESEPSSTVPEQDVEAAGTAESTAAQSTSDSADESPGVIDGTLDGSGIDGSFASVPETAGLEGLGEVAPALVPLLDELEVSSGSTDVSSQVMDAADSMLDARQSEVQDVATSGLRQAKEYLLHIPLIPRIVTPKPETDYYDDPEALAPL